MAVRDVRGATGENSEQVQRKPLTVNRTEKITDLIFSEFSAKIYKEQILAEKERNS